MPQLKFFNAQQGIDSFNAGNQSRLQDLQMKQSEQQMQLQQLKFADQQTQRRVKEAADGIGKAALAARNDAEFQAMLPSLGQRYGQEFVKDYTGPGSRERALMEGQTITQILSGQRQDRQMQANQNFRNQSLGLQRERNDIARQKALQPKLTASQRDLMAAGLKPGTEEFQSALRNKAEGRSPAKLAEAEQKVRKEFQALTKTFRDVRDSYSRVQASVRNPSPAGDLALIFNYMKMLDPGSVVRESEFATAAASGSLGERFKAAGQKLTSGERLSPKMRADFEKRAKALMKARQGQFNKTSKEFQGIATRGGLNPKNVVIDHNAPANPALDDARDAIARGADRDAVIQRLQENGIDASGL